MRKFVALAGVSLAALSTTAAAQTQSAGAAAVNAATSEVGVIGEVVVTARRRAESLQEVPLVVNAVTGDDLAKLNLRKFEDVTAVVPGLAVSNAKTSAGAQTTLRGVNYNSGVSGNNTTVEYYLNDGLIPGQAITTAMFDIGQIEVLRGPQGTLRGRASPSGSINVTTRRPNLTYYGGYLDVTANDIGGRNINGAVNLPIIEEKLGVRIAGLVANDRFDGTRSITPGTLRPYSDTRAYRASVRADPFDDLLVLDFTYQKLQREQLDFGQVESINQVVSSVPPSPVTIRAKDRVGLAGFPATQDIDYDTYNWQARLNLFGQTLTYVGLRFEGPFTQFDPGDDAGIFAVDTAPNGVVFGDRTQTTTDNTSHELRLQNQDKVAGIFDYVIGGFKFRTRTDTPILRANAAGVLTPTPTLTSVTISNQFRDSLANEESIFGNLTAHIGERTEVAGGVRRIWYKINSGLAVNGVDQPLFRQYVRTGHDIYLASIKHRFTDDFMLYANTSSSWRPGNTVIGGPLQPSDLQRQFLETKAETSKNYELGFKSNWWDDRARLNVTLFRQKFKNSPYRAPAPVFAIDRARNAVVGFNYVSSVPILVKGVETEFAVNPIRNWTISGVLTYTDGKIQNGVIPCLDLNQDGVPDTVTSTPTLAQLQAAVGANNIGSCTTNDPASTAPKWAGSVTTEYWRPVNDRMDAFARGLLSWNGSTKNDPVNAFDSVDAYGLLNLYLGVRDPGGAWEVTLYGKNITNTFRVLSQTNGPLTTVLAAPVGTRGDTNYFGITSTPEREFGLNVRVAFGSR